MGELVASFLWAFVLNCDLQSTQPLETIKLAQATSASLAFRAANWKKLRTPAGRDRPKPFGLGLLEHVRIPDQKELICDDRRLRP